VKLSPVSISDRLGNLKLVTTGLSRMGYKRDRPNDRDFVDAGICFETQKPSPWDNSHTLSDGHCLGEQALGKASSDRRTFK
jgi:hypothetical protein